MEWLFLQDYTICFNSLSDALVFILHLKPHQRIATLKIFSGKLVVESTIFDWSMETLFRGSGFVFARALWERKLNYLVSVLSLHCKITVHYITTDDNKDIMH